MKILCQQKKRVEAQKVGGGGNMKIIFAPMPENYEDYNKIREGSLYNRYLLVTFLMQQV